MGKIGGCNSDMVKGPIGKNSTRINPTSFARNNMSKGGVNSGIPNSASVKAGGVAQGKTHQMPKGR